MDLKPRILYFSSQFPTTAMPQMGMFSVQRVSALRNAGCEVVVVSPVLITLPARFLRTPVKLFRWVKEQMRLPVRDCVEGIETHYPKWVWFPKGLFGWYTSYFMYRQIRREVAGIVREFQPDIILSSWLPDGLAACKLSAWLHKPSIAIADGSDVNFLPHSYAGWGFARRTFNQHAAALVFVSKALQEKASSLGLHGKKNTVLYNAVDIQKFRPAPKQNKATVFNILSVGRMVPVKGFNILLEAFAAARQSFNRPARLTLIGDGPDQEALARQAAALGIESEVEFTGAVKHDEIAAYFQQADLFCLSSFSEGSPAVLVEAMACGKPVVASEVGGVGEIVSAVSGILVPAGDVQRLAQALLQAAAQEWDEAAIRKEIEDRYAWDCWTDKMLGLMQAALAPSAPPAALRTSQ